MLCYAVLYEKRPPHSLVDILVDLSDLHKDIVYTEFSWWGLLSLSSSLRDELDDLRDLGLLPRAHHVRHEPEGDVELAQLDEVDAADQLEFIIAERFDRVHARAPKCRRRVGASEAPLHRVFKARFGELEPPELGVGSTLDHVVSLGLHELIAEDGLGAVDTGQCLEVAQLLLEFLDARHAVELLRFVGSVHEVAPVKQRQGRGSCRDAQSRS